MPHVSTPPLPVRAPRPPFASASRTTCRADAPRAPAVSRIPAVAVGDPTQPSAALPTRSAAIGLRPRSGHPSGVLPLTASLPWVTPSHQPFPQPRWNGCLPVTIPHSDITWYRGSRTVSQSAALISHPVTRASTCRPAPRPPESSMSILRGSWRRVASPVHSRPRARPSREFPPIGLVPKKTPGTYRVIHHLSYPVGDSVNAHIPREHTAVQYGSLDDAVELLADLHAPFLAKTDIANAFRLIPIRSQESPLLGFRWRGRIYADRALPMGCSSSSQIFQTFSDALVWIAQRHFGAGPIISVLDDFLFIGSSRQACSDSLTGFQDMCRWLNVPLHPEKTVLPCRRLQFLGVELDVAARVM